MEHQLAVQTHAVERFILGEMTQDERNDFEDHYFGCPVCAEDVRSTVIFAANARAVLRQQPPERTRKWFAWLRPQIAIPVLAALALAAVIGYQNKVTIPALKAPQSLAFAVILDGGTRALPPQVLIGEPLRFQAPLEHAPAGRLTVALVDASGKPVRSGTVLAPSPNQPFDVYFPGQLKPGHYALVVRSGEADQPGQELARDPFEVVTQETR